MVKRSETTGSGITEQTVERETFELPQGVDEHNLTAGSMDQGKAAYDAILRANSRAKLPWGHKQHMIDFAKSVVRLVTGSDGFPKAIENKEFQAHVDEEWYWIEIVRCSARAERMALKGNLSAALDLALTVGLYFKELEMKFEWEDIALVGQKNLAGSAKGASTVRKGPKEARHDEAKRLIDAGMSHREAFDRVADHLTCSASSVRKSFYSVRAIKNKCRVHPGVGPSWPG